MSAAPKRYDVLVARDGKANPTTGEVEKSFWTRVGSAWRNKLGGLNVVLDALPIDGKLVIVPHKEKAEDEVPL